MISKTIQIEAVDAADFIEQLRLIVREEVCAAMIKIESEKFISPAEACRMFVPAITRPTLDKLCREGILTKQFVGARVFFKQSDIEKALQSYKRFVR